MWEVATSRILWREQIQGTSHSVQFNCNGLLALANETNIFVFNLPMLNREWYNSNEEMLKTSRENYEAQGTKIVPWQFFDAESNPENHKKGYRIQIQLNDQVKSIHFHVKGDYLASVAPMATKKNQQVLVHSFSKGATQSPFSKSKSDVQKVIFHTTKPVLIIMTKKHVYLYNLQKQTIIKKLISGSQWNSCLDIHPKGDNLIVGSFDKKFVWFDLDLESHPYKHMKYHQKAIRQVVFHKKYPLFASCADDGNINVFHGKVFSDMMQNALIIPLKELKMHTVKKDLGVLDITFHPTQPWIFSCGADHRIFLWT